MQKREDRGSYGVFFSIILVISFAYFLSLFQDGTTGYQIFPQTSLSKSSAQSISSCGDGKINPFLNEQCDDGNSISGDGCSHYCRIEAVSSGASASKQVAPNMPSCGDGKINPFLNEQCDDGNNINGDGCTSCIIDSSWICNGQPSQCQFYQSMPLYADRAVPEGIQDFSSTQEFVTFAFPVGQDFNVKTKDTNSEHGRTLLGIGGAADYQVSTLLEYQPWQSNSYGIPGLPGEEYAKWAVVNALVDYDETSSDPIFFIDTAGPGESSSNEICRQDGDIITADTGVITTYVRGRNFRGFEEVVVQNIFPPGNKVIIDADNAVVEVGVVVKDKQTGKVYSSQYDSDSTARIMQNGPVYCQIYVQGDLYGNDGEEYGLGYSTVLEFVKGKDYVSEETAFENDKQFINGGQVDKTHKEFEYAKFSFALSQDMGPDIVSFSSYADPTGVVSAPLAGINSAFAIMGRTDQEETIGSGYYSEIVNFDGYYVGTNNGGGNNYLQQGNSATAYPDEMVMIAYDNSNNHYVAVGETYAPYDWSKGQQIKNNVISIETFPEYVPNVNKQYTLGWRKKDVNTPSLIKFGRNDDSSQLSSISNSFKQIIREKEMPIKVFPTPSNYYADLTRGMINGNLMKNIFYPYEPLSKEQQIDINNEIESKYSIVIDDSGLDTTNTEMEWHRHIDANQGGGGPTNRNEINPVLFYNRAAAGDGVYPGGRYISDYSVARHRMEEAVRYLDGEYCSGYTAAEWNSNNNPTLEATNNGVIQVSEQTFFEQEHAWADVLWYYYLETGGNPIFLEAWNYAAEHAKCAWYLNDANWQQDRATGMSLYNLALHYQTTYDPESLAKIQESLTEALDKNSFLTYDGNTNPPTLHLETGWVNWVPNQDMNVQDFQTASDPQAWANVNQNTLPLRGHWPGLWTTDGCGVPKPKDAIRAWMITHRLMNGVAYSWTVIPAGPLRSLLEDRIVDLAYMTNNDNNYDILYIDTTDPSQSGYHYSYCFSNAPFYDTSGINNLVDFSHLMPFVMAYRFTGDTQWLEKGTQFYLHEQWRFATSGPGEQGSYPHHSQGYLIPQTMLNTANKAEYYS